MTTTDVLFFLPPMVAFGFLAIAFNYKEYIAGIIGGLLLFLFGVAIVISPISSIPDFLNLITAVICWGYGAYAFIYGSIQQIEVWRD